MIPTVLSVFLTTYCTFTTMEKNRQNKKIHAEIVAIEASENRIFLHILFTPCFRQYQNVLILMCISALFLVAHDGPAIHGNHPFLHAVYDFMAVGDYDYRGSSPVDLI